MPTAHDQRGEADHPADRLLAAIERAGAPVCVGIDPVVSRLPQALPAETGPREAVAALASFTLGVLDAVAGTVPCVKFQSACFERYRHIGVEALYRLIGEARGRNLQVILDAKRGDIGLTAEHYAAAAFDPWPESDARPDWVTVNAYLGADGIQPFLRPGFGAFVLVRSSNEGGDAIQAQRLAGGERVADAVARLVASIGEGSIGRSGYSALGAVVAATRPDDAEVLRRLMPRQIFLVPGFGAQGAGVEEVRRCFGGDGRGAIVTASRSVIYAFDGAGPPWKEAVTDAARRLAEQVGSVLR